MELANRIATAIADLVPGATGAADLVAASHDVLQAIGAEGAGPGPTRFPSRPETPLSTSALLVNGRDQPRIGIEIQRELDSADHVDLLCAFVKWHGLRVIDEHIEWLLRRGGALRVITTTYMGATESRALDRLVELGAQVRISYETRTTRLHAKAWLFHRRTGYSTAYIGSSNLSRAAMLDGLEWNVRVSTVEQGHLLDTFRATFDQYWEDAAFESYDPTDGAQRARLKEALAAERGGPADLPIAISTLEVRPWGYQREILDELTVEREVHGSWRNLVVMATGTGKTVVAGWAGLRRLANLDARPPGPDDDKLARAIGRMLHVDDRERLSFLGDFLDHAAPPDVSGVGERVQRLLEMLHFSLWGWSEPLERQEEGWLRLWANPSRREELRQLVPVLRYGLRRVARPLAPVGDLPLHVHARYSLAELLAAFGVRNPASSRGSGVRWIEEAQADVFWFNLRKTEKHFSPTTMYADRAISPWLFQWESQNATSERSSVGQRYIHHRARRSAVHLFFRDSKEADGDLGAPAYLYAGPASYVSHSGDRPMRILWKLHHELPADIFHAASVATG